MFASFWHLPDLVIVTDTEGDWLADYRYSLQIRSREDAGVFRFVCLFVCFLSLCLLNVARRLQSLCGMEKPAHPRRQQLLFVFKITEREKGCLKAF